MKIKYGLYAGFVLVAVSAGAYPIAEILRKTGSAPSLARDTPTRIAHMQKVVSKSKLMKSGSKFACREVENEVELSELAFKAEEIVVGTVITKLSESTTPLDTVPGDRVWGSNHTVYLVNVEKYLKGEGRKEIKLRYESGDAAGVHYIDDLSPQGEIGSRYLFFLRTNAKNVQVAKNGFMPLFANGKMYKCGDADEVWLSSPVRG